MQVQIVNNKVIVKSEYCDELISKSKKIGGKWNRELLAWEFSTNELELVKKMLVSIYGENGIDPVDKVSLRINLDECNKYFEDIREEKEFELFGRMIFVRKGRDREVTIHPTVIIEEGGFPSWGGSNAHPRLNPYDKTIFYIKDVPEEMALKYEKKYPKVFEVIKKDTSTKTINTPSTDTIFDILTFKEASELWGIATSTLRNCVLREKFLEGEYRKSGSTWLITRKEMERVYGPQKK